MTQDTTTEAIDPVCGLTVDPATARDAVLVDEHNGQTYYFCGKGCFLEFRDNPEAILDPGYKPSM